MSALEVANANPEKPSPMNPVVGVIYPHEITCDRIKKNRNRAILML
jgi:hypothetical protein